MKKVFDINLEIYPENKIIETIDAFKEFGSIELKKGKLNISGEDNGEIEEVFNEFMNYVVGLINE